jgi:hypothetical protein
MATILYPNGQHEEVFPANGTDFQLAELQRMVGGSIEIVPTNDGRIMVLNEEGKLLGLPRNEQATALVDFPSQEDIALLKWLYGDQVIIVGEVGAEADYVAGTVLVCQDHEVL